jgi:hypothetical protein
MARKRRHRGVVSEALDDIFKNFDLLGDYVDAAFDAVESATAGVVKVSRRRRRRG